jgi:hypothetical protein
VRIDKRSDQVAKDAVAYAIAHHGNYAGAAAGRSASSVPSGGPVVVPEFLRSFAANVEKGLPYAAAFVNHFYTAAVIGTPDAPALWHPSKLSHLNRHNENTKGHTIYNIVLAIPDSCLRAALGVYEALSQAGLSTLGFVDPERDPKGKISRFMAGLQRLAAAPRKYVDGFRLQVYVGQTHAAAQSPRIRYNAHYSNSARNLVVTMQLRLQTLVARSNDPKAKADAARMVTYALFVCGPDEIAAVSAQAGISMNLMTTLVEDQSVAWHGSMVDDAGGNSVWPVADLRSRITPQSGAEAEAIEGSLTSRMNRYIGLACAATDPSGVESKVRASEVRNQVLALPWDVVCNSDDTLGDLLHTYYGHLDPGTISARKLQSLLNSYASSRRKTTAKGATYRAEILFMGRRVWFNRDGVKHAFDEAVFEHGELDRTMHMYPHHRSEKWRQRHY